jgi:predicted dehydrogenase
MRVLIIGIGSIAQRHIEAIRSINPEAEIYALRSGKGSYEIEGLNNIYSLSEINDVPDFVIISNPTSLHAATIKDCLALKRPLFIEKPLFSQLENTADILAEIERAGIITYVACNLRFHPVIEFLKSNLGPRLHKINEVNAYCGSYLPEWRPNQDFRKIYSANADMGGGVHLDLIHELDYCYWLFGKPASSSAIKRNVSSLNISAIDYANYALQYDKFTDCIVLNYYRRDAKSYLEIVMDDATWTADIINGTVKDAAGTILFSGVSERLYTYVQQMKYFTDCISANAKTMNSVQDAYEVLQICLG